VTEPANTIHYPVGAKIKGLDPIYCDDTYSGMEVTRAYETLFQYHYLKRPYQIIPLLAEAMPEISKDRKTYTIHLKKGVLFQDDASFKATGGKGREMTAEDVIYSYKRLADAKLVSTGWWTLDGKIVGLNDWRDTQNKNQKTDYSAPVEGLKALGPYTLQIKLIKPSAQFLFNLAQPFTSVVPHEAVDMYGAQLINHAVGTGPFHLREYNPNAKIVWERNPTYRRELYPSEGMPGDKEKGLLDDAGKPLPLVDRVVDEIFEESQPLWLNFMAGKLEFSGIPKDNYLQAFDAKKNLRPELVQKGIQVIHEPQMEVTHLSFNMADPVVGKNKYLRQAMSLVYDEAAYIETFYNGRAIPAQGPIPPNLAGYDPDFKNPYREVNLQKAKELLAKAGYPNGEGLDPLEYVSVSDSTSRQSNEFEQQEFAQLGIKLKINTASWPEFTAAVKNKKGQLWSFSWLADYPDAENFLALFYGPNSSPGANDANYSNPEYDRLYEQALNLTDSPERTALYKKMVKIVVEDCPWIFGVHRITYYLYHPWLKNFAYNDLDLGKVKYFRVDPTLKK
jgi:ABC-type transport system substrate-binding protein